ncbi:hypothetical protein CBL_08574 [Carabus blaptoides fortunei]
MAELILSGGDITVSSYRDIVFAGPSVHGNNWILDLVVRTQSWCNYEVCMYAYLLMDTASQNVGLMAEEHSCKLVAREVVVPYTVGNITHIPISFLFPMRYRLSEPRNLTRRVM